MQRNVGRIIPKSRKNARVQPIKAAGIGSVAEWLKVPVSKTGNGETRSRVKSLRFRKDRVKVNLGAFRASKYGRNISRLRL